MVPDSDEQKMVQTTMTTTTTLLLTATQQQRAAAQLRTVRVIVNMLRHRQRTTLPLYLITTTTSTSEMLKLPEGRMTTKTGANKSKMTMGQKLGLKGSVRCARLANPLSVVKHRVTSTKSGKTSRRIGLVRLNRKVPDEMIEKILGYLPGFPKDQSVSLRRCEPWANCLR